MEERALMDRIYELSENGMINLMYSKEIKDLENKIEHDLWEASVFEGDMEGEIADGFGIDDNKDTDSTEETKE
jgi:midasin (ATPase involved in ribosome maturation)